jgi:L-fuconate dehydratase
VALTIIGVQAYDIRFPTSRTLAGSDAMNNDPDYSAAYVVLQTDHPMGLEGHGLTFTIGRGNEICIAAIRALAPLVIGHTLESFTGDMCAFWQHITGDSQLRWLGPEKGVIHLATGAVVNAVWDLWAKVEGKPLWKLLTDMTPEQLVSCIDFHYITDALTPDEALYLLRSQAQTRSQREAQMRQYGFPSYTTGAGWSGYSDEQMRLLCREALGSGWRHFKLKVGLNLEDDLHRARIMREEIGPESTLMFDANQVWEVNEAIAAIQHLAAFDPFWIEEPTSPDDMLGHATIVRAIAPIRVASGEHVQNRIIFKQLFQANAIGICQIDACRVGGVNEVLAILLMAAKFGIPVCPHAGGVGLGEYVQHLSLFDYIAISGSLENRMIEYTPHLHEHFVDPVIIKDGRYMPPDAPGYSITMKPESIAAFMFPTGPIWQASVSHKGKGVQRYGQVIGIKPDQIETYERLHTRVWPEVLAMIQACNIHNYSIFRHDRLLFAFFEYAGDDYEADMAKMAADPKTREWWTWTEPMQVPLETRGPGEWWTTMKEVFHRD